MKNKLYYIFAVISVFLLVFIDQFTKELAVKSLKDKKPYEIISGVLHLDYVTNEGAAWGVLSGKQTLFLIITAIILLAIIFIYIKTPKTKKYLPFRISLVLLFSGAIGNFIDRIINNYVHDFIYFVLIDFPIFNIADCYVTVSAFMLIILTLFIYKKDDDFAFLHFK